MATVSSEAIANWWPWFERHARKFDGLGGAEFDDLVQEQAEAAWISMEMGFTPSEQLCIWACIAWCRYISHRGLVYEEQPYVLWAIHNEEAYETDPAFPGPILDEGDFGLGTGVPGA